MPFKANSPTGSTVTAFSTFVSTPGNSLSPKSLRKNGPVTFAQATFRHWPERNMPMLVLVMVFNISVALALGFIIGRIYQIRRDELERRVELPPVAHVPRP
jgi:hypothetical protein